MSKSAASKWVFETALEAMPPAMPTSIVAWAEKNVRIVGSAKTEVFDRHTAPWLNTPIDLAMDPGRYTVIKPVQSGGTTAGEIILCAWISLWNIGDIGYFWPNDLKALDRFYKYTNKRLQACKAVADRASPDKDGWCRRLILFPHLNFAQLGVRTDRNVSSDTLRGIINEEMHDCQGGWEPGRYQQVLGRQRAVWNAVCFNISNASRVGDELHTAYTGATMEEWTVKCPGCGLFHQMRTRWEPDRPHLGGLRYDSDGCKRPDGTYDYFKMQSSVRFQMPCGYVVHDTPRERRALSESGRYSEPNNKSATPNERSFRLEAVALHDTSWLDLIKQKHQALRVLTRGGGPLLYEVYQREQECCFWDIRSAKPEAVPVVLSTRKKDREGLPEPRARFAFLDYQEGFKARGEMPHFWGVIQDFDQQGNALIVWEGKLTSEGEIIDVLGRHQVKPNCTAVDASFVGADRYVYALCLRLGFNAIKVHGNRTFTDKNGIQRVWSEPEPLWPLANADGPTTDDPDDCPLFWNVSQAGAMNALAHLRARKDRKYEIPADVSPEFLEHFKAWSLEEKRIPATNQIELCWKKSNDRAPDHLYMVCTYLAVWAELAGITGSDYILATSESASTPTSE